MNAKVHDVMKEGVMTTTPSQTIGHVRQVMTKHKIGCMPVVGPEDEPVGVITRSDLLRDHADGTPVSKVMPRKVYTVPQYADVSVAARIMRNQHIHHVVVTHEKKVVGIVSSFDLLVLVEEHRFVSKNAPRKQKKVRRRTGGHRFVDMSEAPGADEDEAGTED